LGVLAVPRFGLRPDGGAVRQLHLTGEPVLHPGSKPLAFGELRDLRPTRPRCPRVRRTTGIGRSRGAGRRQRRGQVDAREAAPAFLRPRHRRAHHYTLNPEEPVNRAADFYAQGRSLRQIGAELGVTATVVSEQLRRASVTLRRAGPPAHPASTQQIRERDQGLTWPEIAEQVGMTVSGAWSRYRRALRPRSPRLGRWQQVLADALDRNLAIGVRAAVADHLGRAPTRAELIARRVAHSLAALGRARVFHVPGTDGDVNAGDRNYLVLVKSNVIIGFPPPGQ